LLKVEQMREREFYFSLNRWRGRMMKRFWWIRKGMIFMKMEI
jgi:hypothetical protein